MEKFVFTDRVDDSTIGANREVKSVDSGKRVIPYLAGIVVCVVVGMIFWWGSWLGDSNEIGKPNDELTFYPQAAPEEFLLYSVVFLDRFGPAGSEQVTQDLVSTLVDVRARFGVRRLFYLNTNPEHRWYIHEYYSVPRDSAEVFESHTEEAISGFVSTEGFAITQIEPRQLSVRIELLRKGNWLSSVFGVNRKLASFELTADAWKIFDPVQSGINSSRLRFPQYLSEILMENSGEDITSSTISEIDQVKLLLRSDLGGQFEWQGYKEIRF